MTNEENTMPQVDLENFEIPEQVESAVEDQSGGALKFAFIGSGQCGSRIAEAFYKLGYTKNIVINTSAQDLHSIEVPTKLLFAPSTGKSGAGKDMKVAAETIAMHQSDIYNYMTEILGDTADHVFICAGLGGGTGGGSMHTLINLSRKYMQYIGHTNPDKKVGVIVTLPTIGEASSPIVRDNALEIAEQLSTLAENGAISPMIVIDNNRIQQLYKKTLTVDMFYPVINTTIAQLLHVFNYITGQHTEYSSCDPTDLQSVLEAGGHMILGVTAIKDLVEQTTIADALRLNLTKTLLADGFDLTSATAAAAIIVGGDKAFSTIQGLPDQINYGFDTIASLTGNAKVHRGVYKDGRKGRALSAYTMIGGLLRPGQRYARMRSS